MAIDAIVWATGYKDRTDWVAIPEALDVDGQFVHRRGVSPVPGLFFVGRPWQWTQGSSRLFGVGQDAAYVAEQIGKRLGGRVQESRARHYDAERGIRGLREGLSQLCSSWGVEE